MKNIDKTERAWLIQEKLREGKGIIEAEEEVERDIKYIDNLNEMKKRLTKEIKELENKKIKVSKDFKKQFKKLTKQKEPDDNFTKRKPNGSNSANTKHLNRILYYLEDYPDVNLTKIAKANCMDSSYVRDGLRFLIKLNKVTENDRGNRVLTYKLK